MKVMAIAFTAMLMLSPSIVVLAVIAARIAHRYGNGNKQGQR